MSFSSTSSIDSDTPQIVLQNPGALVVYDPHAHELVVYADHSTNSTPSTSPSSIPPDRQLQPFHPVVTRAQQQVHHSEDEMQGGDTRACRLCHRPFTRWDTFSSDDSVPYHDEFDSSSTMPPAHFTSSNYFQLLAEASTPRQHGREDDGEDAEDGEEEKLHHATVLPEPSRVRRRRQRSTGVEILDESTDAAAASSTPNVKRYETRSASRRLNQDLDSSLNGAAASSSSSSRRTRGVHIRRSSNDISSPPATSSPANSSGISSVRISASSSTDDLTAIPSATSNIKVETPGGTASRESKRARGRTQSAETASESDVDDADEPGGLHRRSFNLGYYARFFREDRKLGSGAVGGVWLTHHVLDGVLLGTYAVKKIPVGNSRSWLVSVLKEVRALEGLHHRHIVAYKHSWLESFQPTHFGPEVPCLFLLMEYADRGTLADRIWPKTKTTGTSAAARRAAAAAASAASSSAASVPQSTTIIPEDEVWCIFIGTLLGLRHLHVSGVIHRDLKPENLLLASEVDAMGRDHGVRVLVSDFGNAILKGVPYDRTGNTGTLAYAAPEMLLSQEEYAEKYAEMMMSGGSRTSHQIAFEQCDLWSCGVILYAMAFGTLPFRGQSSEALFSDIQRQSSSPLHIPNHPHRSPDMIRMIRELLNIDPRQRPSLEDLLARPVITMRRGRPYASSANENGTNQQAVAFTSQSSRAADSYIRPNALVVSPARVKPVPPPSLPPPIVLPPSSIVPVLSPVAERLPSQTPSATPVGAIVLARTPSFGREAQVLPIALRVHQRVMDLVLAGTVWSLRKIARKDITLDAASCAACYWNNAIEGMVQMIAFLIKLWLSLSIFLLSPSPWSMYAYVAPQVFFTLVLVITSFLMVSAPASPIRVMRYQMARIVLVVLLTIVAAYSISKCGARRYWHGVNLFVFALECAAILSTLLAYHPNHMTLHSISPLFYSPFGYSPLPNPRRRTSRTYPPASSSSESSQLHRFDASQVHHVVELKKDRFALERAALTPSQLRSYSFEPFSLVDRALSQHNPRRQQQHPHHVPHAQSAAAVMTRRVPLLLPATPAPSQSAMLRD